jgi:hypothetical protein
MGALPRIFEGDREDVERFLTDLITYIDLNELVPNLASYKFRVRMALSFIQGDVVREWKNKVLDYIRPVNIPDNEHTWNDFIAMFRAQYADSSKGERARLAIEQIKLKGYDIDQYISNFVTLARDAEYDLNATGTRRFFVAGLSFGVANETVKANPRNWDQLKTAAIAAAQHYQTMAVMFPRAQGRPNAPTQNLNRGRPTDNRRPWVAPQFQTPSQGQWRQNQGRPSNFNSSNAPRSFNNTAVPMDLSRARGNRRGRPAFGNVAQTPARRRGTALTVTNQATSPDSVDNRHAPGSLKDKSTRTKEKKH